MGFNKYNVLNGLNWMKLHHVAFNDANLHTFLPLGPAQKSRFIDQGDSSIAYVPPMAKKTAYTVEFAVKGVSGKRFGVNLDRNDQITAYQLLN